MESGEGTLISFSTQPGNVALDGAGRNSPFATALLKHIPTPGDDLPTILINVRNDVMAVTARKQVPWEHSALTAKVYFIAPKAPAPGPTHEQQVELTYWSSVKDSTSPTVLRTYLDRYPEGEFAAIARALIQHYEQQAKVAIAARERERKQQDEEKKAAEVKRIEEERRVREAALVEARIKAEAAKNQAEVKRLQNKERAEHAARAEQLRKAQEEAGRARDAAKAAEEKRLAAAKASEEATKAAEQAIASKKEQVKPGDEIKVAALPKLDKPATAPTGNDGTWVIHWRSNVGHCSGQTGSYKLTISKSVISYAHGQGGSISNSGAADWKITNRRGSLVDYSGTFTQNSGRGQWKNPTCTGTFTATRG